MIFSLHFNFAIFECRNFAEDFTFSQCSTDIYQAFDGQTEFLWVFNFAILSYSRNLRKYHAHENNMACPVGRGWSRSN